MTRCNTKAAIFSFLASSLLLPTSHARSTSRDPRSKPESNCRCDIAELDSLLTTPFLTTYKPSSFECRNLGRKLEHWKDHEDRSFPSYLEAESTTVLDLASAPSSAADAERPMGNDVRTIALWRNVRDGSIFCYRTNEIHFEDEDPYSEAADEENKSNREQDWMPNSSTFVLGCVLVMLMLGILAELIELVLLRSNLFRPGYQPICLTDNEKALSADRYQQPDLILPQKIFEAKCDQSDNEWEPDEPII